MIWAFNLAGTMVAVGINLAVSASVFNVYALGRARQRMLYVALGCLLVLPAYFWCIGWPELVHHGIGTFITFTGGILSVSLIPRAWSYGDWGSSRLRWSIAALTIAAGALTIGSGLRETVMVMSPGFGLICMRLALTAFRAAADGNREARGHAVSWVAIFLTIGSDIVLNALGASARTSPRLGALGASVFIISNLLTLGRQLVETLDTAEKLNTELETKVEQLQRGAAEINLLNIELRRQVAERSRDLADALGRGVAKARKGALSVGESFEGRYAITRLIGRGGMGAVYEGRRITDDRRVAVKVLAGDPTPAAAARFAREAEIAATVSDCHVVAILDVGVARTGVMFLVMEYIDGPSIEQERDRFGDVKWAVPLLRQLADGLGALHAKNVIHRDLKPANVLLADGITVKIADFGISRFDESEVDPDGSTVPAPRISAARLTETGAWIGTPSYMPPEAARGRTSASADVFALGVIAYEMLSGQLPFAIPPIYDALADRALPVPPLLSCLPSPIAQHLRDALSEDPAKRPSIETIRASLETRAVA